MRDIITYIPDLETFREEITQVALDTEHPCNKLFSINEEDGKSYYNVTKIPVRYSGNMSVCLVRSNPSHLNNLSTVERLGECINRKYTFDSEEALSKYMDVRGSLEKSYIDEDTGQEVVITEVLEIGFFS